MSAPRIAVILPCLDEAAAIAGVVADFQKALPGAAIYVYDNGSTDRTAEISAGAGAIVRSEPMRGKGNAVARAFADVDADIYVLADGDGTYEAADAPTMIERLRRDGLDMVVGVRTGAPGAAYRPGHRFGNNLFSSAFRSFFNAQFTDILSGYRVFSRRFVKTFPLRAKGFEIELEISAHTALLRIPFAEMETGYGERAEGGKSKLNTLRDGYLILRRMLRFLRLHRPRFLFSILSIVTIGVAIIVFIPVLVEYLRTGLVPRFPTLIVSVGLFVAGVVSYVAGILLDAQAQYFAETKRLAYLQMKLPPRLDEE